MIKFLESGGVEYDFFRHHSEFMLSCYSIEWPADRVEILGGQCLHEHNFRKTVSANGSLLLEWDKVRESDTQLGRGVHYIKHGYLQHPETEPALWHYRETFQIKPDFSIKLHSPFDRINAVQRLSETRFRSESGVAKYYSPGEMTECVFRDRGTLNVNWTLEVLGRARKSWRKDS